MIKQRKCAIIEVTSSIYKHVKDNKSRLFVGHQSLEFLILLTQLRVINVLDLGTAVKSVKMKLRVISVLMHTYHQSVQVQ